MHINQSQNRPSFSSASVEENHSISIDYLLSLRNIYHTNFERRLSFIF